MTKPTKAHYNQVNDSVTLFFENNKRKEFYVRGGICWPVLVERSGGKQDIEGFALLACQDVKSGIAYIFEQRPFVVIDNLIDPKRDLEYHGLAGWLNKCWARYFASGYFWHQDDKVCLKYRSEVARSELIQPKPEFIEVPWADDDQADEYVWRYIKTGQLVADSGSQLHQELEMTKQGDKRVFPAVHALQCVIAGIDRFPFIDYAKDQEPIEYFI